MCWSNLSKREGVNGGFHGLAGASWRDFPRPKADENLDSVFPPRQILERIINIFQGNKTIFSNSTKKNFCNLGDRK